MLGLNSGLLGVRRVPTTGSASGLWDSNEQVLAKRASIWPFGPNEVPNIGEAFGGGFFAGYISHTANSVATHALIVAPRATGASGTGYPVATNYNWKTASTNTAGTTSTFDGRANTDSMIAAGIANHPAAQFCVNLTIGGFTDWYLPARLELDIAFFNLKPSSASNTTSSGINAYSVPARVANYTASAPAMASGTATAFNNVGAQRFETSEHWTSNETSARDATILAFSNGFINTSYDKFLASPYVRVRAFRRIAL